MNSEKKQIERNGIQNVVLTPQITKKMISLKADFPSQFTHLLNAQGFQNKHATNAGFHISLSYLPEIEANPEHRTRVNNFLKTHFGLENGLEDINTRPGVSKDFPTVEVNKNGIYTLKGNSEFEKDLQQLIIEGTHKHGPPHISLD